MTGKNNDQETVVFLRSGIIWLNDFSVLVLVFGPKAYFQFSGKIAQGGVGFEHIEHATNEHKLDSKESKRDNSKRSRQQKAQDDSSKLPKNSFTAPESSFASSKV
eukprot:CAMPEP_0203786932 /NCGR_PEP_ID=MMETSP0100_2-20121128/1918_1 /ASSEMBLY_ACC=CAM_ASM_000210 /TAXON_ID=96639 /ORGANISM=" , Strain NY0313808BC1" /LENGTH=104 /DNA_ID=CAMNT_0050689323 /DNA_START=859 /DNA_END=1173 /DNA_ORIENTATION=+